MKKKLIAFLLALALIVCMAIPAFAATPTFKPPKLPKIPEIKVSIELPQSVFDNWFKEHPIIFDWG